MLNQYQLRATLALCLKKLDFDLLPPELIEFIFSLVAIDTALCKAASGLKEDIATIINIVEANPCLLQYRGDVVTRGGTKIIGTTLYEFFLGSGYPEAAEEIGKLFALLPDGEAERIRQYERYKPQIEQLTKDIQAYKQAYETAGNSAYHSDYEKLGCKLAYDVKPLIDLIIKSSQADITAELQQTAGHNSELRRAMDAFREAINYSQKSRKDGMHYAHYITIMQVLDLLHEKWDTLSYNKTNYNKCRLVFSQIFGYLELVGLPAIDRFKFANAFFSDEGLSSQCKFSSDIFPDFAFSNLDCTDLGFKFGIVGGPGWAVAPGSWTRLVDQRLLLNHMLSKSLKLSQLMHVPLTVDTAPSRQKSCNH